MAAQALNYVSDKTQFAFSKMEFSYSLHNILLKPRMSQATNITLYGKINSEEWIALDMQHCKVLSKLWWYLLCPASYAD